jgi:hypothetical protein
LAQVLYSNNVRTSCRVIAGSSYSPPLAFRISRFGSVNRR